MQDLYRMLDYSSVMEVQALSDAQLLASTASLTLEFNATVEDVPVYTDAGQTFTLANGTALVDSAAAGITLFQF